MLAATHEMLEQLNELGGVQPFGVDLEPEFAQRIDRRDRAYALPLSACGHFRGSGPATPRCAPKPGPNVPPLRRERKSSPRGAWLSPAASETPAAANARSPPGRARRLAAAASAA